MKTHRVFVLRDPMHTDVVAFVPSLRTAYLVAQEDEPGIPASVTEAADPRDPEAMRSALEFDRATMVITNRCNLRCVYCYENNPQPSVDDDVSMSLQTARATIDYVLASADRKRQAVDDDTCLVNFFGGEPTVAWSVLRDSIEYARAQSGELNLRLRITLSTNGYLSRQRLDWLLDRVDAFNLSIDGPREIHDSSRPTVSGAGSFPRVLQTAEAIFKANPEKLLLRVTISRDSVEKMPEIARFLSDNFPGVVQAYEPLQEVGRAVESNTKGPDIGSFLDQALAIMPIIESRGGKIKLSMLDLGNLGDSFCGVAGSNFIVTAQGLVTSCNRKMSATDPKAEMFIFGKYDSSARGFVFDPGAYAGLGRYTTRELRPCNTCFAQYACRGGCPAIKSDTRSDFWNAPASYCMEIQSFMTKALFYELSRPGS